MRSRPTARGAGGLPAGPDLLPVYRERLATVAGRLGAGSAAERRDAVAVMLARWMDADGIPAGETQERLVVALLDDLLGMGPLEPLLADSGVTEIMVNGPSEIFVEVAGAVRRSAQRFRDEEHLRAVIERLLVSSGRRLDDAAPMVDARLHDGSRLNAVLPPVAVGGPLLTIRRAARRRLDLASLVEMGSLSPPMAAFLHAAVMGRANILCTGGAGTGKTTLLAALCGLVPAHERIVVMEDVAELTVEHPHAVRSECRPPRPDGSAGVTLRDLVRNSLRMRPDRLVVGEVRGGEAADMLTAMNTGHEGSMATLHANSTTDALVRLDTLLLQAWPAQSRATLASVVATAVDLVVHCRRSESGQRLVAAVDAVEVDDRGAIGLVPIHRAEVHGGHRRFRACGAVPKRILERMARHGVYFPPALFAGADPAA